MPEKEPAPEFNLGVRRDVGKNQALFTSHDAPIIILSNPKYAHNVGATVRAASNFGAHIVMFTGNRVSLEPPVDKKSYRLPREERMKDYEQITLLNDDYPFNRLSSDVIPVAVELRENAEPLTLFEHPENAAYVFGPEDGSIPQVSLRHCQRFLVIPSRHCLNLGAAVNVVLAHRVMQLGFLNGNEINETMEMKDAS